VSIEDSFKWTTGLTGTPAGNGLGNLHGQYLVLDKGQRLGRHKIQFETNFMTKGRYNQLKPLPSTKERILALVKDMTLSMSAEDFHFVIQEPVLWRKVNPYIVDKYVG
jgi:hypothetical protein